MPFVALTSVAAVWVVEEMANIGGCEYLTVNFASMLRRAGADVRIVAPYSANPIWTTRLAAADVEVLLTARDEPSCQGLCRVARATCLSRPPDLIQFLPTGESLRRWCAEPVPGVPVIGLEATSLGAGNYWLSQDLPLLLRQLDALIVLTDAAASEARDRLGYSGPLYVVPHTVPPPTAAIEPWRGRPAVVSCIGRLSLEKGAEIAVLALAHLRDRVPDVELHVWGDGEDKQRLQDLAAMMGIADRVRLRGLFAPMVGVDDVARSSTMMLLASYLEGMPGALMEMAVRGIPIVATRTAGAAAVVGEDYPWLARIGDPADLARCMEHLLTDDAAYEQARSRVAARFSQRYHPDIALQRLLDCYHAIVGRGAPALGRGL
ncbi:glycosyltransferase family 4 protein [Sorangium sp. So ce834]|uniref:glycosyltransferase family 4 protein n=1 Tax=Sorangium sp. So ce834 TaxID=3133321 RepID=UPI003F5FEDAA